jgi:DNA-binding transcriptional regulator YiaG
MRQLKQPLTPTAEKLRELRATAGLTQRAAASLLEIPLRTWSDWERGIMSPPDWVLRLIVNEFTELTTQKY